MHITHKGKEQTLQFAPEILIGGTIVKVENDVRFQASFVVEKNGERYFVAVNNSGRFTVSKYIKQ